MFVYNSVVNTVSVVGLVGFDPFGSEAKGYECVIVSFVAFGTNGVKLVVGCWVTTNGVCTYIAVCDLYLFVIVVVVVV